MTQIKTNALVLKTLDWSDTSKIITLFTSNNGLVDVLAKGARRKNNPYAGTLEVLNHIESIIYISKNRELQTIGTVTPLNNFSKLRTDLAKTAVGLAFCELILKLFHEGENDHIFFDFTISMLKSLEKGNNPEILLWYFILKFSSYLGFKPNLEKCVSCKRTLTQSAMFINSEGAFYCNDCSALSDTGLNVPVKIINYLQRLQKINYKQIDSFPLVDQKKFSLTYFLLNYLGYHTDKKIKLDSLDFFNFGS